LKLFAAWIANKPLPQTFKQKFDAANNYGLENINEVSKKLSTKELPLEDYYKEHLSFVLNDDLIKSKSLFLEKVKVYGLV